MISSHGSGDYFDVDSYSGVVTYENISYLSDTTGREYELRDVLDLDQELMTAVQLIQVVKIEVLMAQVFQR